MARTIKTELREVKAKPEPAAPYRFDTTTTPYYRTTPQPWQDEFTHDIARAQLSEKWRAAVAWLRRGKKSKWLLDNVAPAKWRDVFDDEGKASAQA